MKIIINIFKLIVILILTICIIFIGIKNVATSTILNKEYAMQKMEETDFYKETYESVKSNFENYIGQSGLDDSVLEDICTEEKVKNDINIIISNIYSGTNEKIDTTEISDNLNSNIDKLNIRTSKNNNSINKFVDEICSEYKNTILHTKYEDAINKGYTKAVQIIEKVNKVAIIVTAVGILLLIILNIKTLSKLIGNIATAILSASIFLLSAINIINSNVYVGGIKILNDSFSNTIVTIIKDVFSRINNFGIDALIISVILIVIYAVIAFFKKNEEIVEE